MNQILQQRFSAFLPLVHGVGQRILSAAYLAASHVPVFRFSDDISETVTWIVYILQTHINWGGDVPFGFFYI